MRHFRLGQMNLSMIAVVVACLAVFGCGSDEFRYELNLHDLDEVIESATVSGDPMTRDADTDDLFKFETSYEDFEAARFDPPRGLWVQKTGGETVSSDETILNTCSNPDLGTVIEMRVDFSFLDSVGFVATGGLCVGTDGEQSWVN